MNSTPSLSIVVPVYNGASTLQELTQRTEDAMTRLNISYELLFIDDCSKDGSWSMILDLKKKYGGHIRGYRLAVNSGQQAATICGLLNSRGGWIITIDDDLQTSPEDIEKLLDARSDSIDIIYGVYPILNHRFFHKIGTRFFWYIVHLIAPHFPKGSSFRLIRNSIIHFSPADLGPWTFVDPMLSWLTSNTLSVKVSQEKSRGQSRYSFFKLISLAITLIVIYSTLPLRLMIWIGLFASLTSFAIGLYFLYQKLTHGAAVGFSALIVSITFASGIILLCLGILGEYIARIHEMGSKRPVYTIQVTA